MKKILKTPIQQKQIDVSRDSLSLVSRLINIPSMVDSSVDDDYYMTMDETPKLEEHSFSVFDSSEKISFTTSIKNPPQFAPYAPGSKYLTNQIYLTQMEWNDLEIVGRSFLSTRQDTPHLMTGERRGSVAQIVNTFEHQLQTAPKSSETFNSLF